MSNKPKTPATKEEAKVAGASSSKARPNGEQAAPPTLVPNLRFPEFRGAEGWKETSLHQIARPVTDRAVTGDGDNILSLSGEHGLVLQSDYFGKKVAGDSAERYLKLLRNDFVYNDRTTKASTFGTIKRLAKYDGGIVSPIYKCFRFHGGENPIFWEWYFESGIHDAALRSLVNEGARAGRFNISITQFLSTSAPRPDKPEQQKIAECLSSVDELMAAQARKLDALKTHKKGLMQQLFPREGETQPRLRFPEFQNAGEWVAKKLGQFANYTKGFAFKSQDYKNKGIRIVRVSDLGADFIKLNNEKIYISSESEHEYARYKLTASEIIVTTVGSKPELIDSAVGRGIYVNSDNEGLLNQNLLKLEALPGVNSRFLFSHINTPEYQRFIASISRGNANQANIAVKDLMGFIIKAPHHAEQQRIADCLSSLDDLIAAQTQTLEALKTHKQGLMQQLFPSPEAVA